MNLQNVQKLSLLQFGILITTVLLGTDIFNIASYAAEYAKQDAWVSLLIAPVTGVWCVLVVTALSRRYPNMNIVDYSKRILGKWFGAVVGGYYAFVLFLYSSVVAKSVADVIVLMSHPLTPEIVILFILLTICCIAAKLGIEVIGRCGEIFFPLFFILNVLTLIISVGDWHPIYLLPIAENGPLPIVQGAIVPSGWYGELMFIAFLIPFLNRPKQARKVSFYAALVVTFVLVSTSLQCLLIEGPLVPKLLVPYPAILRYITLGDVLERIDPLVLPTWVFVGFLKLAVLIFITGVCVSCVGTVKNARTLMLPVVLLLAVETLWQIKASPGQDNLMQFYLYTFPIVSFIGANLIPSLLLAVDLIRTGRRVVHEQ